MSFVRGIRALACSHPEVTPEDGCGYAICCRCGAVIVCRLTREILLKGLDDIRRS